MKFRKIWAFLAVMYLSVGPALSMGFRGVSLHGGGGRHHGGGGHHYGGHHTASVPEIDATAGIAALAILVCVFLLFRQRMLRRQKQS